MNVSSLPAYPQPATEAEVSTNAEPVSPRMKILWLSLKVVAIFATLFWLDFAVNRLQPKKPISAQFEREPYEFHIIESWYHKVGIGSTREHVEELFGPPTEPVVSSPKLAAMIQTLEWSNRHLGLPEDRVWVRWTDPRDPNKSVTILFAGNSCYHKMKTGFDSIPP